MRRAALALIAPLFLAHPAGALSPDDVIRAALLNGWQTADGTHMAALRLDLAPKWKTYWRAPGDTGIPPVFDWSGSENLSAVRLHWPRPSVFHLNGMQTIGYYDALVLPVEVTPADPARPVRLKLRVDIGVCEDICMPASVSLAADLVAPGAPDAAIRAALDDQPERAAAAGLGDVSCAVTPIADGLRVSARMALPPVGRDEVVVFETGRDAVWIAESVEERQGGELLAWTEMVPPEGAPFALDRSRVVMTVIGEARAVEIRGCPAAP